MPEPTAARVTLVASAPLPTEDGDGEVALWSTSVGEITSLTFPFAAGEPVHVRAHGACATSELLGSLKCDCAGQLRAARKILGARGGILLYLSTHEGRGIGLADKLRAYALQARGLDTVDANAALGLPDDVRDYSGAAGVLAALRIQHVRLLTNNPSKVDALRAYGLAVVREPLIVQMGSVAAAYFETKVLRSGHIASDAPRSS